MGGRSMLKHAARGREGREGAGGGPTHTHAGGEGSPIYTESSVADGVTRGSRPFSYVMPW